MTLRKPEDISVVSWILGDIKPGHLLIAIMTCMGAYFGVQNQVSELRAGQANQAKQIEQLNARMALKLDKEVYEPQQQEMQIQLKGISDTVERIEQDLIERPERQK